MCFVIILKNSTYRILVRENPLKYMKSDMKNSQNLLENQLRHGWPGASFFNNTTCVLPDVPGVCICFFSWRRLPKHSGWTWMCSLALHPEESNKVSRTDPAALFPRQGPEGTPFVYLLFVYLLFIYCLLQLAGAACTCWLCAPPHTLKASEAARISRSRACLSFSGHSQERFPILHATWVDLAPLGETDTLVISLPPMHCQHSCPFGLMG